MRHTRLPALAATVILTMTALPAVARNLEGTSWRTATGTGTVRLSACGGKICGALTRVTTEPGQAPVDGRNPNPALRTRQLVGLNILTGFTAQPDGKHVGGQIYDPSQGKTYRSEFKLKPDGKLEVKGCIGPLCRAQIWTPMN